MSEIIGISNGRLSAEISTAGAELVSLIGEKGEYIRKADGAWAHSAPVLFPICGRLKNGMYRLGGNEYCLKAHGFASESEFTVHEKTTSSVVFELLSTEKSRSVYPFDFSFRVGFFLVDNCLTVKYIVENRGESEMLYSVGSHEGYSVSGARSCTLELLGADSTLSARVDENGLMNGEYAELSKMTETVYDSDNGSVTIKLHDGLFSLDTLIFKDTGAHTVLLRDAETDRSVRLSLGDFPHLLVWKKPGAGFVCLEVWNGLPDDSDTNGEFVEKTGLLQLAPGECREHTHTIFPE